MKKKYEMPKTMDELLKIYYGPNKNGKNVNPEEIKRYEKALRNPENPDISPDGLNESEREIKEFLGNKLGTLKKVKKQNPHDNPPDFEILDKNIFCEVKSINIDYGRNIGNQIEINLKTPEDWREKIDLTIKDICKKRIPKGALYFGVLYIDDVFISLGSAKEIFKLEFIEKTQFKSSLLDALLIYPQKTQNKTENPVLFSKSKQLGEIFQKCYDEKELRVYYLT
jgi:hypothetical protein